MNYSASNLKSHKIITGPMNPFSSAECISKDRNNLSSSSYVCYICNVQDIVHEEQKHCTIISIKLSLMAVYIYKHCCNKKNEGIYVGLRRITWLINHVNNYFETMIYLKLWCNRELEKVLWSNRSRGDAKNLF